MDTGLVWLLLFPVIWPVIAMIWLHETICWRECLLNIVIIAVCVAGVWYAGKYTDMKDIEIWNGQITGKDRDHGSYVVTYPCNCRSCGKSCTTCSVCTTTHYTVTWTALSTAGNIRLAHLDSTSPGVYASPDPEQYKRCQPGQPAAVEHSYVNYVKAVPESLFHLNPMLSQYDQMLPGYPRVHDYYRYNRVLNIDSQIDPTPLNDLLNKTLKELGPEKQVNIVVILTEIDDPNYKYAVENAWLAGKKNDVIVYIGLDGDQITWADATIWVKNTGNEFLAVILRDSLKELKTYNAEHVWFVLNAHIQTHYKRPNMEQFEYLLDEIDPPLWAILLAVLFAFAGSLGLTYYFHHKEVFEK